MDINGLSDSDAMSEVQRAKLADYLEVRVALQEATAQLNRLRVQALRDGSASSQERVNRFTSAVVAPLRSAHSDHMMTILKSAVNVEELKSMLPMALMALAQGVDIPMVLAALGLDPDQIEMMLNFAKGYFREGMDS